MIIVIEILIITALVLINILLLAKVRPIVKDTVEGIAETVSEAVNPKEPDAEYERLQKVLQNIEAYDGSGKGQAKI